MPEENFLTPVQAKIKKSKKKTVRRKKIDKSLFKLGENLNISSVIPRSDFKNKANFSTAKNSQAKNIYRKIAFSFVALTIILVLAVLYFGLAKITLVIIPTQEKISDSLNLEVIDKNNNSAVGQDQILGVVRQVPVEQSRTFSASGKEVLGQEVTGKVTIINDYLKNQPLVASTRLLSQDNKLFRLKNTVNIPAGGRLEVEVYADQASQDMAIGPSKFTIPGLWAGIQDKIYGQSSQPMKYSEKIKYIIKQSDIDNAISELKNNLLANAKKEVSLAFKEYDQSILQVDNNSLSQEVRGKVGEEKENFSIKMKTLVSVVAFNDSDVYEQAKAKFLARLADDKEIAEFNRQDIVYTLSDFNLNQGVAAVNLDFSAKVVLKDGASVIKRNNLTGLSEEQLKIYLNSLPEVAGYEIKFFPSFIRKVPNLVDRINIEIKR